LIGRQHTRAFQFANSREAIQRIGALGSAETSDPRIGKDPRPLCVELAFGEDIAS
jgi:hypothetical protein